MRADAPTSHVHAFSDASDKVDAMGKEVSSGCLVEDASSAFQIVKHYHSC